jgi:hypothetical protein
MPQYERPVCLPLSYYKALYKEHGQTYEIPTRILISKPYLLYTRYTDCVMLAAVALPACMKGSSCRTGAFFTGDAVSFLASLQSTCKGA